MRNFKNTRIVCLANSRKMGEYGSNGGVLCLLPVLPRLVPAWHGVATPEPAKKATDPSGNLPVITWRPRPPAKNQPSTNL